MTTGQFRFAFFARDYESTVAFYRDGLELPIAGTWDRHRYIIPTRILTRSHLNQATTRSTVM